GRAPRSFSLELSRQVRFIQDLLSSIAQALAGAACLRVHVVERPKDTRTGVHGRCRFAFFPFPPYSPSVFSPRAQRLRSKATSRFWQRTSSARRTIPLPVAMKARPCCCKA